MSEAIRMAIKDVVKVNRKTFFNPRAWLGYDGLKGQTLQIYRIVRGLFTLPVPTHEESYQEALVRLNITDQESQETGKSYLIYSIIFFVIASATFTFGFILLFYYGTFAGWLISLATAALFFAQAFRYNFWYFQIKHRKLGCTFAEWKAGKTFDNEGPTA
jgi:intracellular multiplication protein IcmV